MQRFGARFDHNLHAVRIVESFEQRYARFPGLNLTFEVREGIAKHSRDFGPGENPDLEEYLPGLRPPLEAQLIDLADEIAYNTADLDDAVAAGLLRPEEVAAEAPYYRELYEAAETQFPGAPESARFHETLRCLIDALVSGLIEGTVRARHGGRRRERGGCAPPSRAAGRLHARNRNGQSRFEAIPAPARLYGAGLARGARPRGGHDRASCSISSWSIPTGCPRLTAS